MKIQERIDAFAELGEVLRNSLSGKEDEEASGLNEIIHNQHLINPWFTPENVTAAIEPLQMSLLMKTLSDGQAVPSASDMKPNR